MPRIILQTRFTDDTVQFEHVSEGIDLLTLLAWALENTHWARAGRVPGGDQFYLNERVLVSIDGAEFAPVYDAVRAEYAARDRRLAA